MYTSEGTKLRTIENQLAEHQKQSWAMLVCGITLGFVGLHFLVARPMSREMAQMQRDLTMVEQRMNDLVGARDGVWETNSLLASLKAQYGQTEDARTALQAIRELRGSLIDEATRNEDVARSLESVTELQTKLLSMRPTTEAADGALQKMKAVEAKLVSQQETNVVAAKSLDEMVSLKEVVRSQVDSTVAAKESLDKMIAVNQSLRDQQEGLTSAADSLKGLVNIKTDLAKAAVEIDVAQTTTNKLVAIEKTLVEESNKTEVAQERVDELLAINSKLGAEGLNVKASAENLGEMLKIQSTLAGETKTLVDAVASLEILNGFRDEFVSHVQMLSEMRRSLVELGMLEVQLTKIARMMKPLTDISSLQRLGDDELRQAAQMILNGRTALRVSRNGTESRPQTIQTTSDLFLNGGQKAESFGPVPMPTED